MPCSSLDIVWITETEHQVFLQTGYHAFFQHASALYMHAEIAIFAQRQLNLRRNRQICAEIVVEQLMQNEKSKGKVNERPL